VADINSTLQEYGGSAEFQSIEGDKLVYSVTMPPALEKLLIRGPTPRRRTATAK
jgi:hypothetical protein